MVSREGESHAPCGSADDGEAMLESCLERLAAIGPLSNPEQLREMLPDACPDLQRFILLELIKLDMALRAEAGQMPALDGYLESFTDLISQTQIPVDLVLEEIQLRKELRAHPTTGEYRQRFPQLNSILAQLACSGEATAAVGKLRKPPELVIGSEVDDFVILRKLGEGAFAQVYLARQLSMQRLVALKVSMGRGDEPQALAQFDHPNIVRVFDQRSVEEPPVHLLYMQYHPGGTLADVVKTVKAAGARGVDGRLLLDAIDQSLLRASQVLPDRSSVREWIRTASWPTVVSWIGVQLARALQNAHQHGMLHRDVKPANVLLTAEGTPKLADFNVSFAGAAGRAGAAATFGGSIGYMAPEHLRAISTSSLESPPEVGRKADLYSLSILLWELWQGHRPFLADRVPASWSEAIDQQLEARRTPLMEPHRNGGASERVLEKTLRVALRYELDERPDDAAEMAGRLKLALHPEAASLLDPGEETWRSWIASFSPWLVAGAVILLPNVAAGFLNYQYNSTQITQIRDADEMREYLKRVSIWLNAVFFPLGAVLMVIYARRMVHAVKSTRAGDRVTNEELEDTLNLGYRAAMIGGMLWFCGGVVFTAVLSWKSLDFVIQGGPHMIMSMLICGGVAMAYPMFGMALLVTFVYYPLLVRGTMKDDFFEEHRQRMTRQCDAYLLVATLIPLLALALLIPSGSSPVFMLTATGAGFLGLLASFFAYRLVVPTWDRFAEVLSNRNSTVPRGMDVVPGEPGIESA